ncbi:signal transduction histidine kinase [Kutzneria buriramensis]|uniref:histidine kinase n=2 Tax=Kutzneria buriramensis TaxID=1045776 RepID=A0A3E0HZN8_9PSEU|nr:signal transduction histidine kinase [Kutzneria buriramensis]
MMTTMFDDQGFVPRDRRYGALSAFRMLPAVLALTLFLPQRLFLGGQQIPADLRPWLGALALVVVAGNLMLLPWPWPERRAALLSQIGLLVITVTTGVILVLHPDGVVYGLPFWTARLAVRYRRPNLLSYVVIALSVIGAGLPQLFRDFNWLAALGIGLGVLLVALLTLNRQGREERLEQAELLLARRQQVVEEHARAAALAERARIAREVHDVLAHSLAGLSLTLQGTRLMLQRDNASQEVIDQVSKAQKLAADGLAEARRAVAALRDDKVPDARAIADLVTAFRLESGAPAELTVNGEPRDLPAEAATALYRTAQEALTNARKHAPGAPVDAVLDFEDGRTVLTVIDHPGKPPAHATSGGYGLLGMRERAELIGGELETGPMEDGWRVRLVVPA